MKKIVALVVFASTLAFLTDATEAAQKKPGTSSQTKSKVSPYERCRQLVATHSTASVRIQRYKIMKDGTIRCWYYP